MAQKITQKISQMIFNKNLLCNWISSYLARPSLLRPEVLPLEHQVPVEPAAQVGAGADVLWQHNVWAVVEPAFMLKFLSNYWRDKRVMALKASGDKGNDEFKLRFDVLLGLC